MPNYAQCRTGLERYLTARVPVITVNTIEQQRGLRLVSEAAQNGRRGGTPYWIYTRSQGLRDLRSNASVQEDRSLTGAMEFAAGQFTSRSGATLILVDPDDVDEDNQFTRHLAELARLANESTGSIVLITGKPVFSALQRLGMSVRLDLPDADEMYETVSGFLADQQGTIPVEWSPEDTRRAAEFLLGVTEGEAINLLATTAAKGSVEEADVVRLAQSKDSIFNDLAGLERMVLKPSEYAIGGLNSLRDWLERRRQLIHADLRETSLRPPRGVLLVGVPGCGKSLSAKAVAAQWELPLYRLDMANIHSKYHGESESRLREALDTADRVAPCIVWIDEIEKGLSGREDSSGVSQRLVGQFLFWLQESNSRAFVVATANDVRGLPPELLRKGRFDELFFVDLPSAGDRREIISLHYRRYLHADPDPELLERLVDRAEGFAGSDVESALHEAGEEAMLTGGQNPGASYVLEIFENTVPLSRTNPEQIEEIRAWGRDRARPAGRSPAADATPGGTRPSRRILYTARSGDAGGV
jgi:ATPase family associated with various cellular activities (AAA)